MKQHAPFLRWLLIVVPITIAAFFAFHLGFFHEMWEKDQSYIGFSIFAIFAAASGWIGRLTYKESGKGLELGWFLSRHFLTLGMAGTVIGMIMIFSGGFENFSGGDAGSVQRLILKLSNGLGTALYTTLAGLASFALLQAQLLNLTHTLEQKELEAQTKSSKRTP
jgi:hypothetical protein